MNKKNIRHLIITRFNVNLSWAFRDDGEWIKRRIVLFEKYCLPSVKSQTVQDFKWLVFFDKNSPDYLVQAIEKYREYENFIPIFVEKFDKDTVVRSVNDTFSAIKGECEYLVTTRLDNDDAINIHFIETIQQNVIEKSERYFLNFLFGYRYNSEKLCLQRYASNSFITMVEKYDPENILTVFSGIAHGESAKLGEIINLRKLPAWLIVIHDDNIGNKIKGILRPPKVLADDFVINVEIHSCLNVGFYFRSLVSKLRYYPHYWFKDIKSLLSN